MKIKTILIIVITALITIILMKNTDSVEFWIFGIYYIQKLVILAVMFVLGIIVGLALGRSTKKKPSNVAIEELDAQDRDYIDKSETPLSDQDQDYIR